MNKRDGILIGLCLIAIITLASTLLLLDPAIHARFLGAIDALGTGIEILFGMGILAIGVKIWKMFTSHTLRDGKGDQTVRAVIYKGQVVQLGSAEGIESHGTAEHIKQLEQYLNFTKKMIATAKSFDAYYGVDEDYEDGEEDVVDEEPRQIDRPRSEYLHIADDYQPHADEFLSAKKLIVGITGSGKSNTVGTLCEELGGLDVPMILADTENEYEPLCNPRWLPHGILADRTTVNPDNAREFGQYILEQNLQVILNLQSYELEEGAYVMVNLIAGLRGWQEARANEMRIPCELLLEEATTWLPQNVKESPLHGAEVFDLLQGAFFNDMVRKGRKRGLGLTVICQKIAEIDKRALQCEVKLLHRQTELIDLEKYNKMGITHEETLALANGEGYFFSSKASKVLVQVRRRHSPHGANTPGLQELRQHQQSRQSFPGNLASGNKNWQGNDYGNTVETASVPDLRVIDGVFPSEIDTSVESPSKSVSGEKRETIRRLVDIGMAHRDVARIVGLSGRNYHTYQQVCREEGIVPHEAMEGN